MEIQKQSPLYTCHVEAQGHLQSFAGWHLPAWYKQASNELAQVRSAVGISDASYLTKLDVRDASAHFALSLPTRLYKLTAAHSLITSPRTIPFTPSAFVTDVTSVYSAILLAGPLARAVLHKLTTLNVREAAMPNGAARQTRLAHVNATLLRIDSDGLPGFLVLNTRDVAEHVWHTLLHAGADSGVQPFGIIAQQQWMGFSDEDA